MSVSPSKIHEYTNKLVSGVCPKCNGKAKQIKHDSWHPEYKCQKCNRIFKLYFDDVGATENGEDIVELIDVEIERK